MDYKSNSQQRASFSNDKQQQQLRRVNGKPTNGSVRNSTYRFNIMFYYYYILYLLASNRLRLALGTRTHSPYYIGPSDIRNEERKKNGILYSINGVTDVHLVNSSRTSSSLELAP